MVPRRYRVFLWVGPLVLLTWLIAALGQDNSRVFGLQATFIALFWGTMFGHTTLAAVWSAFGPAPLVVRLPLSFGWLAMLPVAIFINLHINGGPTGLAFPIGACLLGQWLFLQFPLWGLAIGLGLRLQHCDNVGQRSGQDQLQFTIRQLLVITTIVGVLFGIGRVALPVVIQNVGGSTIFVLLTAAEVVLTLPLVLAALLRRFAITGVLLALVLISAATAWEMPLLQTLGNGLSVEFHILVAINTGTVLIVLLVLTIVRLSGYSLSTCRSAAKR